MRERRFGTANAPDSRARIVVDDLARLRDPTTACGARFGELTVAAIQYVEGHIQEGLPPAVAQVYLDDPGSIAIHDCEDCGYEVPIGYSESLGRSAKAVRRYFDRCPLGCGKTGYYAYQRNARLKKTAGPAV